MWRPARPGEDQLLVDMCLDLNREDPGPRPIEADQVRRTLAMLRSEPSRGRAVVLDVDGCAIGYALLISFWSNELGGEVCQVDELFVVPEHRSRGHGRSLFASIEREGLWPTPLVAIALGVTSGNTRARRLYESLGFAAVGTTMVRRLIEAR